MFLRRRAWSVRSSAGLVTVFGLGVVLFGLVAAPFCRCNCAEHDTASAAEAPACHGHAHHHGENESPDHPCNHAGCSGFSATIPMLPDRKSTRLNSSHGYISYAVFC